MRHQSDLSYAEYEKGLRAARAAAAERAESRPLEPQAIVCQRKIPGGKWKIVALWEKEFCLVISKPGVYFLEWFESHAEWMSTPVRKER